MNIKPLADRVVVKPLSSEEVTIGGIVLPDSAKEKPQEGEVVAVGPGRTKDDGGYLPMPVAVGQRVLYAKYAGTEVKDGDQTYLIVNADRDILAVIE